jgi:hypothetical protein
MPAPAKIRAGVTPLDEERMRDIDAFTARTMNTSHPVPFGALIVHTKSGRTLMRTTNAVLRENDPSSHAEVRTVRLACTKLKQPSLAGYSMYSTCEPCPNVHGQRDLSQTRSRCLRRHHRRHQSPLSADPHSRYRGRQTFRHGLRRRRPGSPRSPLLALHASKHAESLSQVEFTQGLVIRSGRCRRSR